MSGGPNTEMPTATGTHTSATYLKVLMKALPSPCPERSIFENTGNITVPIMWLNCLTGRSEIRIARSKMPTAARPSTLLT